MIILFFRMTDIPKIEDIVAFSIDYVCELFSSKNVVEQSELFYVEKELVKRFNLRNCDSIPCLFRPVYWYLKDNYLATKIIDPMSDKLYWIFRNGTPDREYFKQRVLEDEKIRTYLKIHLERSQSFS